MGLEFLSLLTKVSSAMASALMSPAEEFSLSPNLAGEYILSSAYEYILSLIVLKYSTQVIIVSLWQFCIFLLWSDTY